MKSQRYDGTDARRVLTGMITDPTVAARIAARWTPAGLFASKWENLVAGWCVEYARKYGKAPHKEIETYLRTFPPHNPDELAAVEKFLAGLSAAYEANGSAPPAEYLLDLADRVFNRVNRMRVLREATEAEERGDGDEADKIIAGFRHVELGSAVWDDLADPEVWDDVYSEDDVQPLFVHSGGLGTVYGSEFARDTFIAYQASEGRGKSWFLLNDVATALMQKRKVAYFVCGDMSRKQTLRRLGRRLTRRPKRDGVYRVPVGWPAGADLPDCEEREISGISPQAAATAVARYSEGKDRLRVRTYSADTATAATIGSTLTALADEGWVADIVVVDYADILSVPSGTKDEQDGINKNWMHLRRIATELHCCVITATQANAASYDAKMMRRKHFSRDKRKYAHVTAMIGINQNDDEKRAGIYRQNWLKRRDEDYNESVPFFIAGNLDLSQPAILLKGFS